MTRPNFLLFVTDEQRADHLGCYGNPIVRTRHIDSLAKRGLAFDRFYVASPICMPNRSTLMTGRMPSVNGVYTNGLPLPLETVTFVDLLRAAGYRTALVGKCHLQNMTATAVDESTFPVRGAGEPPPAALREAQARRIAGPEYERERSDLWVANPRRDIETPHYGFDHVRFANLHGDLVEGHYTGWLAERHSAPDSLRGPANALPGHGYAAPQAWRTRMPEELYPTSYVADETISYLEDHARDGGGRPFFVQCSFPDPHHPFTPPGKYWDMYDPDSIPVPPSHGARHVEPPPFMLRLQEEFAVGAAKRDHVQPFACTAREAREIIALTYGMITMIDDAVGRILSALSALGLDGDTVVAFTSDHGDLMGDHGLMLKHCFHQEGLIRAPFVWADPADPAAARADLLSGTIDIASTVLARAGLAPYHGIQGFDVVTAAREGRELPRRGMMIEEDDLPINANVEAYTRVRSFVTGRWRLTFWPDDDFCELYDRRADPLELVNLWNDPASRDDKAALLEEMALERIALEEWAPRSKFCA